MPTATKLTQGELFPVVPFPPCNATATSKAAARGVLHKSERVRQDILSFLRKCGTIGATDEEMQHYFGLSGNMQRARRWELCGGKHGQQRPVLIVDSGRTRKTASGKGAIVWVVK